MKKFLSCDWGTTSFRLRVVETPSLEVIAEEKSDHGIAQTFQLWKESKEAEGKRVSFYLNIIRQHIEKLEKRLNTSLNETPLVISGMASSTVGMIELPYKEFPFAANGSDLITKTMEADNNFSYHTIIVSGAKTNDDAMRGEETMLAGCLNDDVSEEQVFIFPGTHSKHIAVKNSKATTLKTYMTGEFFELLSKKSILSVSIKEEEDLAKNIQYFKNGVNDSDGNLLNNCFHIRANDLFGKLTKQQNYYYLSGLLIGSEMKELVQNDHSNIILVSNETLSSYYETAFNVLNESGRITAASTLKIQNGDEAVVKGQFRILCNISRK